MEDTELEKALAHDAARKAAEPQLTYPEYLKVKGQEHAKASAPNPHTLTHAPAAAPGLDPYAGRPAHPPNPPSKPWPPSPKLTAPIPLLEVHSDGAMQYRPEYKPLRLKPHEVAVLLFENGAGTEVRETHLTLEEIQKWRDHLCTERKGLAREILLRMWSRETLPTEHWDVAQDIQQAYALADAFLAVKG